MIINDALRQYVMQQKGPLEVILRRVVREELSRGAATPRPLTGHVRPY
jgi:hypothetical protein